ncbi:hypothetical protein AWH56_26605 [Anaerobacillus isosaccharinicus]|uniref:Uncharacterized protein n=1 Tax=Anaerobacillus isosaccharinicus TaxID=1532552 RepID=A0AC62A4E4_9BACI|nr:hypothetical protein [Anaerobacillus isosaccharinicus]
MVRVLEENVVKKEIELDPELKEMIKRADKDIEERELYDPS